MTDMVIEKISVQQSGKENTPAWMVGEQLKDICRNIPGAAEIVMQDLDVPEMDIEHAARELQKHADALHKKNGGKCICIPPKEAEDIIKKFYGIDGLAVTADGANSQALGNLKQDGAKNQSDGLRLEDFL